MMRKGRVKEAEGLGKKRLLIPHVGSPRGCKETRCKMNDPVEKALKM